jgi:enoyl-CoA hydratase
VRDLGEAFDRAAEDGAVRGVMLAAEGKLFCPGLDLVELIELGRDDLREFLRGFNACMLELYAFPKPVVAAIHGHAIAGGCILALTADWRVLLQGKMVGLNELQVGVPFPFGVALILREQVGSARIEEVALFGRNYRGSEAVEAGLVHEVCDENGFADRCLERLRELAGRDGHAFAVTKRYLRAATIERISRHEAGLEGDFLDGWFSRPTQERLREIVAELRS